MDSLAPVVTASCAGGRSNPFSTKNGPATVAQKCRLRVAERVRNGPAKDNDSPEEFIGGNCVHSFQTSTIVVACPFHVERKHIEANPFFERRRILWTAAIDNTRSTTIGFVGNANRRPPKV